MKSSSKTKEDAKPDLSQLKAEMAAAHPDKDGSSAAFIKARERYEQAKRQARKPPPRTPEKPIITHAAARAWRRALEAAAGGIIDPHEPPPPEGGYTVGLLDMHWT